MKTLRFLITIVLVVFGSALLAQKEKSSTKSALVTAQSEAYKDVLTKVYKEDDKVDVYKVYKQAISEKTSECLAEDLELWGKAVIEDAENGKFRKYRLSFEKPSENTFKVPTKAKRKYKRAFKRSKKSFIGVRKRITLTDIMEDKHLKKFLGKTNDSFERQFRKHLRKITK
ncbi:hypothetical protein KKG31_00130 [Patescibacteria group bacterium]|nr:hypothetical protein [Patescibacteria group bacterium]MBU1757598.1 hypothetical protein [Patescibacteria group bacterium]